MAKNGRKLSFFLTENWPYLGKYWLDKKIQILSLYTGHKTISCGFLGSQDPLREASEGLSPGNQDFFGP
jgi:hypothetical protein